MTTYAPTPTALDLPFVLRSGSGRFYVVEQITPKTTRRLAGPFASRTLAVDWIEWGDEQEPEGPTCGICDGLGHGYPGGGPCPLESPAPDYYAYEMAAGR